MSPLQFADAENVEGILIDVCQLLDGWHQDGTAWSPWDEGVRQRVGGLLRRVYNQNQAHGIRATQYTPPAPEDWAIFQERIQAAEAETAQLRQELVALKRVSPLPEET